MKWSAALFKFVLGVIIAIALLVTGSVALALIFINRSSTLPPKPIFANDSAAVKKQAKTSPSNTAAKSKTVAAKPASEPVSSASPASNPSTNKVRVTWEQGLSIRAEPSLEAERIGSLDYNQEAIVLEKSQDQKWERIRLEDGELEGWIKAGNTEPVEAE